MKLKTKGNCVKKHASCKVTHSPHVRGAMRKFESVKEQLEYLNQFLEEQLWYTNVKKKDLAKSQEGDPQQRALIEARLETKYWMIQDLKAVLNGDL